MVNIFKNKTIKLITQWLSIVIIVSFFYQLDYFKVFDDRYNDYWRLSIASQSQADDDILIIEIDDQSLTEMESEIGRWPWPRTIHGFLVEGLIAAKAKVIIFDILFSEKDLYQPAADIFFAETISQKKNIFFAATELSEQSPLKSIAINSLPENFFLKQGILFPEAPKIKINLPLIINKNDWNIGLINNRGDDDGVTRKYSLQAERAGWKMFSLPLKVADYLQSTGDKSNLHPEDVVNIKYNNTGSYNHLSYVDARYLLHHQQQLNLFEDKIVIIGPNATGLHDYHKTPIDDFFPGTNILATVIDNLIHDDFLMVLDRNYGLIVVLSLISLLGMILLLVDSYKKQLMLSGLVFSLSAAGLYVVSWQLSGSDILFPSASIMVLLFSSLVILFFYRGLKEYLSRQHALQTFSRFMDPVIVKQLIADEDWHKKITNKTSQVSVLFSDIRGFTKLSEDRNAEEIMHLLNAYFSLQIEAIFQTKGTLDKFIGDAIMAFWGAPIEDEQHAIQAVDAALLMVDNLIIFKDSLPEELKDFDIGIGVHSGEAVVGMLGTEKRFDYTAIGDTVNLASRIEGATKGLARVFVSEKTKDLCDDVYHFEYAGEFSVKGRERKVNLYKPSRLSI